MATGEKVSETTPLLLEQQQRDGMTSHQSSKHASTEEERGDTITILPPTPQATGTHHRRIVRSASVPYGRTYSHPRTMSLVRASDIDDLHGHMSEKEKGKAFCSAFAILFSVMLERCTYFSVLGNLVLYCTNNLVFSSTNAVTINLLFTGVAFLVPVFAGKIADSLAGRYNAIYFCFLIYLLGAALLPAVSFDYFSVFGYDSNDHAYGLSISAKRGFFLFGITLVAIGAGGIKANISPFGAQQVEQLGQEGVQSFFNWFYWFVNIGGFIAYIGVVYVQQQLGFFYGYLIPALTLLCALILFVIPRNNYTITPPGNVFGFIIHMLWEGTSFRRCFPCCSPCPRPSNEDDTDDDSSEQVFLKNRGEGSPESNQPNEHSAGSATETASAETNGTFSEVYERKDMKWLDAAKISYGGSYVDEEVDNVKKLIKTLPVFATLILFSTFTAQTTTTMLLQGERMNPHVYGFVIPAAMLNVFKMIIIVIMLPILDRILYPALQKINKRPSLLQRIGIGMLIGVLALLSMGAVEIYRKEDLRTNGGSIVYVGKTAYNASDISIMWQIPQFLLTGVGDAFTLVTALEFSYTESPVATQGLMMGVNHLTTGFGNFFATILYNGVASATLSSGNPWLPDELNDGHLESYVFLLAGLLLINFICFIFIARWYKYNELGVVALKRDIYANIPPQSRPRSRSIVEHMFFER